jgi:tight adherence protein C
MTMELVGKVTSYALQLIGPVSSDIAGALALLFLGIVTLVFGIGGLFFAHDVIGRRLAFATTHADMRPAAALRQPVDERGWFERLFTPNDVRRSATREKMLRAGYRSQAAVALFYTIRAILTLAVPVMVSLTLPLLLTNLSMQMVLLLTLMSAVLGFILPSAYIDRRIEHRQDDIRNGFPDALDMLLVCVEAGLGLDAAMQRTTFEIGHAHPVIAEEFTFTMAEIRAGRSRIDALRDMARRIGVDEVSAFVTVIAHAERFGSSVADTLRIYAAEMRAKRMVRAEEKANQLPIKLSLVVGFCTVPAMIILVMAPAIVTTVRGLGLIIGKV